MNAQLIAAAVLSAAATALGQACFTTDSTITLSMSWSDNGAGNGNNDGVLDPGESALITMSLSFTNQGGPAHFSPPVGNLSSGTVYAFALAYIDLNGSGGTQGVFNNSTPANQNGTSGYGALFGWRIAGSASNGHVNETGVDSLQLGQFAIFDLMSSLNPIPNIYRLLWTPATYAPRHVTFQTAPSPLSMGEFAAIYIDLGNGTELNAYLPPPNVNFGGLDIPVVPAPGGPLSIFGLTALTAFRRRQPTIGEHP